MVSSRAEGDVRSAKRQAFAPAIDYRTPAVAELDDAIWTSIVEFLPIPNDFQVEVAKTYDARVFELAATWQTLLSLRLVNKKLAALLHPREKTLWRRLVLQSFDFSSGERFNDQNCHYDHGLEDPGEDGGSNEDETKEELEQDPQRVAMRGRYEDMPGVCLEEDLVNWSNIGIYHRPSQYGFLTTLQQQPPEGTWPETEDAFTLFGDIVRLLQLPLGDDMDAHGEGSDSAYKYLAAPTEAGPSSRFYRYYVMKTLGYVPHIWHRGEGFGGKWQGFVKPEEMEAMIIKQLVDGDTHAHFEDDDESFAFPDCTVGDAQRLFQHVREHCRDWRSVSCSEGSDGYTPVFFVGESEAIPHRWTGYML